jgi:DNA invertase Pin-like site-specific DNA recombinase
MAMQAPAANPPSSPLLRAAQYLRMSTEHQRYSPANQAAAIALYAAARNIGIVRSFLDEGKSGTTIKGRHGLQELLAAVLSGTADFEMILVYDVSRWGRFPDADEAAHYEFLCKQAGYAVRYCAEHFENDNSATSNLLKALKRMMAAEYSRDLSVKIYNGQRRLAALGFWQGGAAPFGMVRQIIDQNGELKEKLGFGEWKSTTTQRTILRLGPVKDLETIQLAFDLYTKGQKSSTQVAEILNQRKHLCGTRPWSGRRLRDLFTNPSYKGVYAFCKKDQIGHVYKRVAPEKWLVCEQAFPRIVSDLQWAQAGARVREETKSLEDAELLEALMRLWKRAGTLNYRLINSASDVPSVQAYQNHFGGVDEAYKLIGFRTSRDYAPLKAIKRSQLTCRKAQCEDFCAQIRAVGGTATYLHSGLMLINGNITVKLRFATGEVLPSGMLWRLGFRNKNSIDVAIIALLDLPDRSIFDYFVAPALSGLRGDLRLRKNDSAAAFMKLHRFSTLAPVIETFRCCPIQEEHEEGPSAKGMRLLTQPEIGISHRINKGP